MNIDKARDYFSAYYEETLESGLKQSFEQKLKTDKDVAAEYDSFVRTMNELDELKFEEIPVPIYLNARITDRLEAATAPTQKKLGLVYYLPRLGLVAAAAVAIIATIVAIPQFRASSGSQEAGLVPQPTWPKESIQISGTGSKATVNYSSATERTVTVFDKDHKVLQSWNLDAGKSLNEDLTNPNIAAAIFEIQVSDSGPDELIAVPGSQRTFSKGTQSGSLTDFALALADRYGNPVLIESKSPQTNVSWSLDNPEAKDAVDHAFDGLPLQEVQTGSGTLSLQDK